MDKHWCLCTKLKSVARDGWSTCSICGGKDAYGTAKDRPYLATKVPQIPANSNQITTKFQITKLEEAGYHSAVQGVSLSYNTSFVKATNTVLKLRDKDLGHNKFLEAIQTWWDITAPRYWWQEMDTYRVGVTKQSESTIHTLKCKPLSNENFAQDIPDELLQELNKMIEADCPLPTIKNLLPEGFLQRRIVNINYKSLRNMILQRRNHKLKEWRIFCDEVLKQVKYPYLLPVKD